MKTKPNKANAADAASLLFRREDCFTPKLSWRDRLAAVSAARSRKKRGRLTALTDELTARLGRPTD